MPRFNVVFGGGGNDAAEQPICEGRIEALETYGWAADVTAEDPADAILVFNATEAEPGCKPEPGEHYFVAEIPDAEYVHYAHYTVDHHEAIAPAL